jgi:mRNA interferase RelE/StbE
LAFEIKWTKNALTNLDSFEYYISKKIVEKINSLCQNPFDKNVKILTGLPYYKLRIGDYRIIFDVQRNIMIILIIKIGHRKNMYNKM